MNKVIYLDDKEIFNQNMEYFEYHFSLYNNFSKKLNNLFGDPRIPNSPFLNQDLKIDNSKAQHYANIAQATQNITESVIKQQVEFAYDLFLLKMFVYLEEYI